MISMVSLFKPERGGSIMMLVGLRFSFFVSFPASPQINSIFVILLRVAFSLAFFIASSFFSIPITFLTFLLINIPIVPVPQYKSKTISSFVGVRYSFTLLYRRGVTESLI